MPCEYRVWFLIVDETTRTKADKFIFQAKETQAWWKTANSFPPTITIECFISLRKVPANPCPSRLGLDAFSQIHFSQPVNKLKINNTMTICWSGVRARLAYHNCSPVFVFRGSIACNYLSRLIQILPNVWNKVRPYLFNVNTESISVSSQNMLTGALLPFHHYTFRGQWITDSLLHSYMCWLVLG